MKVPLSSNNPLGPSPLGLTWEYLKELSPVTHLDYGTHDGRFLRILHQTEIVDSSIGIDINSESIKNAENEYTEHDLRLITIKKNELLPFQSESIESISMIGVLEHIYDQERILKELFRVLKPEGNILILVPGKNLFSFLDLGNFKFLFPSIHKVFIERKYSKEFYRKKFVECPDGLFGDIETEKMWHQHFSIKELKELLEREGFTIIHEDGLGFMRRLFIILQYFLPNFLHDSFGKLLSWDAINFESAEIFVLARKERKIK